MPISPKVRQPVREKAQALKKATEAEKEANIAMRNKMNTIIDDYVTGLLLQKGLTMNSASQDDLIRIAMKMNDLHNTAVERLYEEKIITNSQLSTSIASNKSSLFKNKISAKEKYLEKEAAEKPYVPPQGYGGGRSLSSKPGKIQNSVPFPQSARKANNIAKAGQKLANVYKQAAPKNVFAKNGGGSYAPYRKDDHLPTKHTQINTLQMVNSQNIRTPMVSKANTKPYNVKNTPKIVKTKQEPANTINLQYYPQNVKYLAKDIKYLPEEKDFSVNAAKGGNSRTIRNVTANPTPKYRNQIPRSFKIKPGEYDPNSTSKTGGKKSKPKQTKRDSIRGRPH